MHRPSTAVKRFLLAIAAVLTIGIGFVAVEGVVQPTEEASAHNCSNINCPSHQHYACDNNTGATNCLRWQLANFQWIQGPYSLLQQQWGYVAILCSFSSTVTNSQTGTKWWPNDVAPPAGGGTYTHLACQYPRTGIVPWSVQGLPFWP